MGLSLAPLVISGAQLYFLGAVLPFCPLVYYQRWFHLHNICRTFTCNLVFHHHRISTFTLVHDLGTSSITEVSFFFLIGQVLVPPLPEGDQKGRTSKDSVPEHVVLGDHLYAERRARPLRGEAWRDVVPEAAGVCHRGGVVVREQQRGGGLVGGSDFQLLVCHCSYIHGQHHVGPLEALSDGALELRGPTVLPELS